MISCVFIQSLRALALPSLIHAPVFCKGQTGKCAKRLKSALFLVAVRAVLHVAPVFFGNLALLPERDEPLRDQDCAARILTKRNFFLFCC